MPVPVAWSTDTWRDRQTDVHYGRVACLQTTKMASATTPITPTASVGVVRLTTVAVLLALMALQATPTVDGASVADAADDGRDDAELRHSSAVENYQRFVS